jgi:hypothetical protein
MAAYVLPLFVVLVPLLDAGTVTITRMSTGRAVSARGLDHLHHRLLSRGLSHSATVLFCCAIAFMGALYATTAAAMPRTYLVLTVPMAILVLAPFALFLIDLAFEVNSPGVTYGRVQGLARMILSFGYRWRLAEVCLDLFLATAAYFAVFLLWTNFRVSEEMLRPLVAGVPWILAVTCSAFYVTGVYRGIWRFVGLADVMRFARGVLSASLLVMILSALNLVPFRAAAVVLFGIVLFNLLLATRLSLRVIPRILATFATTQSRILIVGTYQNWEDIVHECSRRTGRRSKAVGFVDDDLFSHGMLAGGLRVLGATDAIERIYSSARFDEIVIADGQINQHRLLTLQLFAQRHRVRLCNYSVQLQELVGDTAEERLMADLRGAVGG